MERRARLVLLAGLLLAGLSLSACSALPGGSPGPKPSTTSNVEQATLPKVSTGSLMPEALTIGRCAKNAAGVWSASGEVTNPTDKKLSFDVKIHVGPADGSAGVAHVKRIANVKPEQSVPWTVHTLQVNAPDGPCQIQVRVSS